ncbi:hypothetical protein ACWDOR_22100 [Streptosporangium canum]|uniref:hypothetical protein n=1 Tax=Streptosporangium canum TaxID=324952 RepID=UPI0037BD6AF5
MSDRFLALFLPKSTAEAGCPHICECRPGCGADGCDNCVYYCCIVQDGFGGPCRWTC